MPSIPEIHPISDLARDAKKLVERARQQHEPIIITQRGREVAILMPIELYREMDRQRPKQVFSPRLVHPEEAERFRATMSTIAPGDDPPNAKV